MFEVFFLLPTHQTRVWFKKTKTKQQKTIQLSIPVFQLNLNLPSKFFYFQWEFRNTNAYWIAACLNPVLQDVFPSFSLIFCSAEGLKWASLWCWSNMEWHVFCTERSTHLGLSEAYPEENGRNVFPFPYICWYQYIVRFCFIFPLYIAASLSSFHFYFYRLEKCHFLPVLKVDKVKL